MSLHEVGLSPTPPSSMLHLGVGGAGGGGGCVPMNMMAGLFGAGQLVVDEEFLHHYQVYDILASRSCLFAARSAPPAFVDCDLGTCVLCYRATTTYDLLCLNVVNAVLS